MNPTASSEAPRRTAYTVKESAALLGIPESTIYDWAARGQMPSRKIGRRVLIPAHVVDDFDKPG